jgi:hypothetical protein
MLSLKMYILECEREIEIKLDVWNIWYGSVKEWENGYDDYDQRMA